MHSDWLEVVTRMPTFNQSALFHNRRVTLAESTHNRVVPLTSSSAICLRH